MTTMPNFRFLNLVLVDPIKPPTLIKMAINIFVKPLFGALPKLDDLIRKYVQICHGF